MHLNGEALIVRDTVILDAASTFNFDTVTVRLARPSGYTLTNSFLASLLGDDLTLTTDQSLVVDGVTVLGLRLRLNGGTLVDHLNEPLQHRL